MHCTSWLKSTSRKRNHKYVCHIRQLDKEMLAASSHVSCSLAKQSLHVNTFTKEKCPHANNIVYNVHGLLEQYIALLQQT